MKTLHVMGLDFTYKAALQGYESVVLRRSWNGIGEMDLTISSEVPNASLIAENDLLYFGKDYHKAYIVERIETVGTPTDLIIKALSVDSLLADYITSPPAGYAEDVQSGTREQVVRGWVTTSCIPPDPDRPGYSIALGTYQGYGGTTSDRTRFKNLADEIARVLAPENLGWGLTLDVPGKQFIFNVYQGTDRTKDASGYSPRVYFGLRYNNIQNPRQIKDQIGARTVAYVGGQGAGVDRTIVKVTATGANRIRETFVDARDTDALPELTERGSQALAEAAPIDAYEFEVLNRQFRYESEYDLGDFVTVVRDKDTYENLQIKHITEVYERGNVHVLPEFGKAEPTQKDIIGGISARVATLEGSEVPRPETIPPVATIMASAASAIPGGWLECNGQAVSREDYASLFEAIGTTYGAGDGSSTFNVPDLKGRTIAGHDTGQTEFDVLGETGGEKTHTLTVAEMPAHSHDIKMDSDTSPDGGTGATASEDTYNTTLGGGAMSTGGGGAHNNLQPYMALKWIIKF